MKKISDSTSTANPNGEFTEGSPAAGVPATLIKADWLNSIQREILAAIGVAGIPQSPTDDGQLAKALKWLGSWKNLTDKPSNLTDYSITIASQVEAEAGTDNAKPMTALRVAQAIAKKITQATETAFGWAKIATAAQVATGTDTATIVTPATLATALTNSSGRLYRTIQIDASTTYTPVAQVKRIEVEIVGGGGAGAGAVALTSGQNAIGGGGGAGGYAHTILDVTDAMRAGIPVTIGSGGVAGTSTGGTGGTTSFGTFISAIGGTGGTRAVGGNTAFFTGAGGSGGRAAVGGVLPSVQGEDGANGQNNSTNGVLSCGGAGGRSQLGVAGDLQVVNTNGNAGVRGGGGSGVLSVSTTTSYTGGKGGDGCCVIREYT
ncbi:hypothetical protein [Pseudomonas sp. NPDC090201]|uniref:glycine-rich domain-containing protein n=1 Tax=Pseudomonas sp. NPDC090201 TaxID=3364475 RepID=UPI003823EF85